jgi:hypothetical protein
VNPELPDAMTYTDQDLASACLAGVSFSTFDDIIVQDGDQSGALRTKYFKQSDMTPIKDLKGSLSKTRFFGPSHWMNAFIQVILSVSYIKIKFRAISSFGHPVSTPF